MNSKFFVFFAILLLIPLVQAFDENTLSEKFVNDQAGILTPQEEDAITFFLDELEKNSTLEFAVVTIDSLEGDSIQDASFRAAEKLGVGKSDIDNGLLLFIAMQEREWRVEVGYGLEGAIPDVIAGRIGNEILVPALANGEYAEGIFNTLNELAGYALEDPSVVSKYTRSDKQNKEEWIFWVIIAIFILILIISRKGRGGIIFMPPMGGRNYHGRGGGGFGGGFGGFGGGGFGGGGAGGKF